MSDRGMFVGLFIGMLVMMAMSGCPPERASLHGGVSPDRENELHEAGSPKGAMREVAMVEARDRKHADKVEKGCGTNREPAPTDEEDEQAAHVKKQVGSESRRVKTIGLIRGE